MAHWLEFGDRLRLVDYIQKQHARGAADSSSGDQITIALMNVIFIPVESLRQRCRF